MADATQSAAAQPGNDGMTLSPHVRLEKVGMWGAGEKASNKSTDSLVHGTVATTVAQIPAGIETAVYYDSRPAHSETIRATGSLLSGVAAPSRWTSLLATVLLFGFLIWRRTS